MSFLTPEKFFGITRPCSSCPFRDDRPFELDADRARSIAGDLRSGGNFVCHKTVAYTDDDDGEGNQSHSCMCAGARATAAREGVYSQVEQVASRLGMHVPDLDDDLPVYPDLDTWVSSKRG